MTVSWRRLATRASVAFLAVGLLVASLWLGTFDTGGVAEMLARVQWRLVPLALGASVVSMGLRFVRWQFLLRVADVRVPVRRSLSIYLASLMGTVTPAYVGEVVRALFLHRSFGIRRRVSVTVLVFERLLDMAALVVIGIVATSDTATRSLLGFVLLATLLFGALALSVARGVDVPSALLSGLTRPVALAKSFAMSLGVWISASALVSLAAFAVGEIVGVRDGVAVFSTSTVLGALTLMPAGAGATGSAAIVQLEGLGFARLSSVAIVTLMRASSIGLWLSIAAVFLWRELRSDRQEEIHGSTEHFDAVAGEYDMQFSEHIWNYLLARKMDMVADAVDTRGKLDGDGRGLDLGCGLGMQVRAMRERGYRVVGIDTSHGLVTRARRAGEPVVTGSALSLPFADGSLDFVYTIGVLHHLPDSAAQLAAVAEVHRVLRPGGRLVVHETNPRNLLFSFYMGYVFPLLKAIDEGTEWWVPPQRWEQNEHLDLVETRYFTFLPDFIPNALMPPFRVLERMLERSRLRRYSVHYMAVLEKA